MDQDLQQRALKKVGQLHNFLLLGLASNAIYLVALLLFILFDPKVPDFITIDHSILRGIAAFFLVMFALACAQSVHLLWLSNKARAALNGGRATDGVLLAQSWVSWPVGMPACIVAEDASSKSRKLRYFAVIPLDLGKYVRGLANLNSQSSDSSELRIMCDAGTRKPVCLVGEEQSFIVCWNVPRWALLRKIDD